MPTAPGCTRGVADGFAGRNAPEPGLGSFYNVVLKASIDGTLATFGPSTTKSFPEVPKIAKTLAL